MITHKEKKRLSSQKLEIRVPSHRPLWPLQFAAILTPTHLHPPGMPASPIAHNHLHLEGVPSGKVI
jgi:hypothetical protein